jgi:protein-S-isoprenylcysteine O-methyltransferase Ste14
MRLLFFTVLFFLYFTHDIFLSWRFRYRYSKAENFLGNKAPDNIQAFFGKAEYVIVLYYLLVGVYLFSGFSFWGLISDISILDGAVFQIPGLIFGILFLFLMTLSRMNLGSSWRVGLDNQTTDKLVITGSYRFVRNPYFLFLLGFLFSLILVVPNAVTIFAFIQSLILLRFQVIQEEQFLEEKYGRSYLLYKGETVRFIPGLSSKRRAALK